MMHEENAPLTSQLTKIFEQVGLYNGESPVFSNAEKEQFLNYHHPQVLEEFLYFLQGNDFFREKKEKNFLRILQTFISIEKDEGTFFDILKCLNKVGLFNANDLELAHRTMQSIQCYQRMSETDCNMADEINKLKYLSLALNVLQNTGILTTFNFKRLTPFSSYSPLSVVTYFSYTFHLFNSDTPEAAQESFDSYQLTDKYFEQATLLKLFEKNNLLHAEPFNIAQSHVLWIMEQPYLGHYIDVIRQLDKIGLINANTHDSAQENIELLKQHPPEYFLFDNMDLLIKHGFFTKANLAFSEENYRCIIQNDTPSLILEGLFTLFQAGLLSKDNLKISTCYRALLAEQRTPQAAAEMLIFLEKNQFLEMFFYVNQQRIKEEGAMYAIKEDLKMILAYHNPEKLMEFFTFLHDEGFYHVENKEKLQHVYYSFLRVEKYEDSFFDILKCLNQAKLFTASDIELAFEMMFLVKDYIIKAELNGSVIQPLKYMQSAIQVLYNTKILNEKNLTQLSNDYEDDALSIIISTLYKIQLFEADTHEQAQVTFDELAKTRCKESVSYLLRIFEENNLLDPDSIFRSQQNALWILNHKKPYLIVSAIKPLLKADMINAHIYEKAQENIDALVKLVTSIWFNFSITYLERLLQQGLLTSLDLPFSQGNYQCVVSHKYPSAMVSGLINLYENDLLPQAQPDICRANREILAMQDNPDECAELLVFLDKNHLVSYQACLLSAARPLIAAEAIVLLKKASIDNVEFYKNALIQSETPIELAKATILFHKMNFLTDVNSCKQSNFQKLIEQKDHRNLTFVLEQILLIDIFSIDNIEKNQVIVDHIFSANNLEDLLAALSHLNRNRLFASATNEQLKYQFLDMIFNAQDHLEFTSTILVELKDSGLLESSHTWALENYHFCLRIGLTNYETYLNGIRTLSLLNKGGLLELEDIDALREIHNAISEHSNKELLKQTLNILFDIGLMNASDISLSKETFHFIAKHHNLIDIHSALIAAVEAEVLTSTIHAQFYFYYIKNSPCAFEVVSAFICLFNGGIKDIISPLYLAIAEHSHPYHAASGACLLHSIGLLENEMQPIAQQDNLHHLLAYENLDLIVNFLESLKNNGLLHKDHMPVTKNNFFKVINHNDLKQLKTQVERIVVINPRFGKKKLPLSQQMFDFIMSSPHPKLVVDIYCQISTYSLIQLVESDLVEKLQKNLICFGPLPFTQQEHEQLIRDVVWLILSGVTQSVQKTIRSEHSEPALVGSDHRFFASTSQASVSETLLLNLAVDSSCESKPLAGKLPSSSMDR